MSKKQLLRMAVALIAAVFLWGVVEIRGGSRSARRHDSVRARGRRMAGERLSSG